MSAARRSGSAGHNPGVLKQSSLLFLPVIMTGVVVYFSIWDAAFIVGGAPDLSETVSGGKTSQPLYVGATLEAWRNGSLSGRQLHAELGLKDAVIPAIYNCFSERYPLLDRSEGQPCFYLRTPIPVIGTNTVNNPAMLRRLVLSIDVPVQVIVIVVNTIPGEAGKQDELDMLAAIDELQELIGRSFFKVVRSGCNRGCAGGWNTIVHSTLDSPWWLIINDDAAFVPGALRTLYDYVSSNPNVAFYKLTAYQVFIITQRAVAEVGVFDENIWPAYVEDCDYDLRLKLSGVMVASRPPEFSNIHGDPESGSSSSLIDTRGGGHSGYGQRSKCSHSNNRIYYQKKWNLSVPGCGRQLEGMFQTPHGNPSRNLDSWTFDEEVRARSESCWEPSNRVDNWLREDAASYYAQVSVPGDQPASNWGQNLIRLQPEESELDTISEVQSSGGKDDAHCVSPFAEI
ncbi:hypothetical protein KFL_000120210 [Klebsormidium nitens]|uniref:Glycosyltransferase 2-like domain-containing protein n=1 Tax=Klebsormidium nitens TaxID=105231 RepID=A0A1Y1HKA8_KLENI|nr:hypothetical protein KFL_000120210 [Klebsormidium nitens]|eukprot:GAQ78373.1 hypothetical protein KFL_000120210 [Klebsormidium nitens]